MKAYIDIENSHTRQVLTYECPILEFCEEGKIRFDISALTQEELKVLSLAISKDPSLSYTDIEMFFIDDEISPYFGPDYDFEIVDSELVALYNRKIYVRKGRK